MFTAAVLGNGKSRLENDLTFLRNYCNNIWGCNALYRDSLKTYGWLPDAIVAVDSPMIKEIESSDYKGSTCFRKRYGGNIYLEYNKIRILDIVGGGSGSSAILTLCEINSLKQNRGNIFLFGFDFNLVRHNSYNNVYENTPCYKSSNNGSVFTGNFIIQLKGLAGRYPLVNFYHVLPKEVHNSCSEFDRISNIIPIKFEAAKGLIISDN